MSPSLCFLGIPDTTWAFINSFAGWFSAFGSIAAVVTALYLARNQRKPKLRASISHKILFTQGMQNHRPEYICINAVNTGARNVRITNLGGRVGYFKKQHFVILAVLDGMSSKIPVEIEPGQEANWFLPFKINPEMTWTEHIAQDLLKPNWKWKLRSLRFQVYTSVGSVFYAGIHTSLMDMLKKACLIEAAKPNQKGTRP
jgi:hypothetical protein